LRHAGGRHKREEGTEKKNKEEKKKTVTYGKRGKRIAEKRMKRRHAPGG